MPKKGSKKRSKEVDDSGKELEELRGQLLRVSADFENFRRRTEEEKAETRARIKIEIFEKLLPLLDNFSRAVGCAPDDEWSRGVCQLFGSFEQELRELGLKKIDSVGEKFDTEKHEALIVDKEGEPDIIMEELQPGWMVGDLVVRPAKVRVGG